MKFRPAAVPVLLVALAAAAQTQAASSRHIVWKLGDAFVVAGTNLACESQVGTHVMKGQKLVSCFKVEGGRLPAKSYVAALGANGRVVVGRVDAKGAITASVFDRTPAMVGAARKQFTAHAGDQMLLAGTNIACSINDDASGVYPVCLRVAPGGGVPGSYAFAETEQFVAVVQFDASGKKTKVLFKREHGR